MMNRRFLMNRTNRVFKRILSKNVFTKGQNTLKSLVNKQLSKPLHKYLLYALYICKLEHLIESHKVKENIIHLFTQSNSTFI